ncbi:MULTISPECIES: RNA-guided endonuclease TnpB family protein [unclassified Streptomyces]|uniref:RNA-guided endonuclease InsQ/TnpB family protein n=1 Tax=unclassified Streptomyces TaxID=2593676 RepID=UPI002E28A2DF|nr:RNA-guided endonuclease TnpB family protein [Streptomyces sp. NBC_00228]
METLRVKRAFKYRFYPTAEQAVELLRTFGCVRKVYNMALHVRSRAWTEEGRRISYAATSSMLTEWKKEEDLAFLAEVSCVPLQQSLRHLQAAFTNFFTKRAQYPRFKSRKRSRAAAEYTRSAFKWRDGHLTLAKMDTPLDIRWSRRLPDGAEPSTVTVSRDSAGRWFVSILVEDAGVRALPVKNSAVGIDVGINSLIALSTGEKVANPTFHKRDTARLAAAQRELARKEKGSKNQAKAREKVAKIHARIADRRRDYLHKLTTRLVRENQLVVIEDLPVHGLMRNRTLARAIADASWAELRSMLDYKCAWYGRELVVIDRFFPSSKTCALCGLILEVLPLGVRDWTCEGCGTRHDRDHNAAENILAAGLAVSACGAGVRPQRSSSGRAVGDEAGKTMAQAVGAPAP